MLIPFLIALRHPALTQQPKSGDPLALTIALGTLPMTLAVPAAFEDRERI